MKCNDCSFQSINANDFKSVDVKGDLGRSKTVLLCLTCYDRYYTGVIEEFCGFPVTTEDICNFCNKKFTIKDKGLIGAYKPWMHSDFWHVSCMEEKTHG